MPVVKYKSGNNWVSTETSGSIATDSTYGYVKVATVSDITTGTNNTAAVTAKALRDYDTNAYVHKTGDETIDGTKTFSGIPVFANGKTQIRATNALITDTTRTAEYDNYGLYDKNGTVATFLEEAWHADGSRTFQIPVRNYNNTAWEHVLQITTPNPETNAASYVYANNVWNFTQTINGTSYRSLWGDLAEYYLTDKEYPKGTLVQFGGEKEITIATNKVNAVITSDPGFILNGEMKDSQAIALVGRVPVRVIGKVKKFDKIALSYIDGVGCVNNDTETPIGIALQDKIEEDESLVLCCVKMSLA